jgi:hypothetical protein
MKPSSLAPDGTSTLPKVPPALYDLLNPLGMPRRYGTCPDWSRWAGRLRTEHKTKPKIVAAADTEFQRYHDDHCPGCRYGLSAEGGLKGEGSTVLIPGQHQRGT